MVLKYGYLILDKAALDIDFTDEVIVQCYVLVVKILL